MSPSELLVELRRRGVRLVVDGESLRFVGERKALDAELLRELSSAKSTLLTLLRVGEGGDLSWLASDLARDRFEERAAILEFDAGYTREEAERLAAMCATEMEAGR